MNNISDINNSFFSHHQFNMYCNGDNNKNDYNSESISETPLACHASSPSSSTTSNIVNTTTTNTRRQPRGKINKRACMNCRKLKVKCDGDALAGKDCTNCGKGTCVFDQSPRKNRQVENLTRQLDGMTETLRKTHETVEKRQKQDEKKMEILQLEKDILQLERDISQSLFKCLLRFQHESVLLSNLMNMVNENNCRPLLGLLYNLLSRILEGNEDLSKFTPTLNTILDLSLNNSGNLLQIEEMSNSNIFNISIIDDDNNIVIPNNNYNNNIIHSNINSNINSPILPSSPSNSPSCNYNYNNLHPNSDRNASTPTTPIMTTPISTSNHSFSNSNNIIDSPVISDIFTPSTNENNNGFNSPSFIIDNLYYAFQ